MTNARCAPDHVDVPVAPGQTLLDALLAAGVPVAHACGGQAKCSTCRVRVVSGADRCEPRPDDEAAMAARLRFDPCIRLACRTRVGGDVEVRRLVLDRRDETLVRPGESVVGRDAPVAVLFADIADFTPLSEALPPYDVVHLLNRWFAAAGEVVERHGGHIDNYLGDGFLAVFGLADEAAGPAGAVRAGLDLLREAESVSEYARELYGRAFGVRVGIHHGTAVVGALGAPGHRRETVIGDTVNVAARIEAANKECGTRLLVSDAVADRVRGTFRLGRSFDAALKGKTGAHRVHEVLGPGPGAA